MRVVSPARDQNQLPEGYKESGKVEGLVSKADDGHIDGGNVQCPLRGMPEEG